MPWRNGAGLTRVVATGRRSAAWRVSLAEVTGSADYSPYPGWHRWSCVVAGSGLRLSVDDVELPSPLGRVVDYPGVAAVRGTTMTAGETVSNLNLMVALDGVGGMHARGADRDHLPETTAVVTYMVSGSLHLADGRSVGAGMALLHAGPSPSLRAERVTLVELSVG